MITTLFVLSGLLLLAVGAQGLVRGSTSIALRFGVTPLVIGLTIVAFGTGSPELFVSIEAASRGNSGIALGNVIGSNICNIGLILGVSALARPMRVRSEVIRREMPLMIAVTMVLVLMLVDGYLSRLDGGMLAVGTIAYTAFAYHSARRDRSVVVAAEFERGMEVIGRPAWLDTTFVAFGLVALLLGAKLLLTGATAVAVSLGVSQVVIGLTVIAVGTSLPELATSVVASIRGEADVAFGNVIGSNILNILCILGIAAIIRPFAVSGLRTIDMGMFIGTAIVILPLMWRGHVLNRWEGAGLLLGYVVYMSTLAS